MVKVWITTLFHRVRLRFYSYSGLCRLQVSSQHFGWLVTVSLWFNSCFRRNWSFIVVDETFSCTNVMINQDLLSLQQAIKIRFCFKQKACSRHHCIWKFEQMPHPIIFLLETAEFVQPSSTSNGFRRCLSFVNAKRNHWEPFSAIGLFAWWKLPLACRLRCWPAIISCLPMAAVKFSCVCAAKRKLHLTRVVKSNLPDMKWLAAILFESQYKADLFL